MTNFNILTFNNKKMIKQKKSKLNGFTFVELIVAATIIVILSAVWFSSYISYIADSRDTQRKSDIAQVTSALKIYKQKRWYYAIPWNYFNITYSGTIVAYQWKLNENVRLNSLEKLPFDPRTNDSYFYSTTTNKQEFEIAATLENEEKNIALLWWNYKSVSKNILPTIMLATWATIWSNVEVKLWAGWDSNRTTFIYNNQRHNLPYNFVEPYSSYSDDTSFDVLLTEVELNGDFWQNNDFRNCTEIDEAWKLLIPLSATAFEYQIITNTWALTNTWCTQ